MHDFRRLNVWQRARDLSLALDAATRRFPRQDRGILAGQLRRAGFSVPACIAEGCGRNTRADTIRFLGMAASSAREVDSHLDIAGGLGYIPPRQQREFEGEIRSIQNMLFGLMKNLPDRSSTCYQVLVRATTYFLHV